MKKVLALVLALAMVLSVVACSGSTTVTTTTTETTTTSDGTTTTTTTESTSTTESAEPTQMTIILRGGTYSTVIEACLDQFEADNNCEIEVLECEEADLKEKIALDSLNAEGTYDLCMVDGSWMAEFSANGILANLSEMGYSFDDDIIPATTAVSYYNGDIYLAPYYGNVTVLLFNKANVEAAGYTGDDIDSLDDILTICQKAQADGKKGFLYRGDTTNNTVVDFLPILASFGTWVVDDNNQPTVNTPEFKEALEFYLQLIATGEAEVKNDLIASCDTGSGTMGIGWPGWYSPTTDSAADYCAITGVAHEGDTANLANVYGCWTIGIPANSTKKDLALKLLEYLMDADVQKSTISIGGVPCRYSSLQDPDVLAEYPQYAIVCAALENGRYRPIIEQWGDFYEILGTEMSNIINGVKTVDQGLADAQTKLDDLMK